MRASAIFMVLLILAGGTISAQQRNYLGLYFNSYSASEEFSENITRNPIGIAFSYLKRNNGSLLFGGELSMGLYSGKKYFYETVDEGVPDNIERIYEENGFFSYQTVVRYLLVKNEVITPYIEVKAGASTFFSAIRAMQVSTVFDDGFLIHDTALNFGAGGGISMDLGDASWRRKLILDLTATYQWGTEVTYRNSKKDILVSSFEDGFTSSVSNAMHYKVGLVLLY